MGKKGQVAIFIIIGILIVAGVASYFIFSNEIDEKEPAEITNIGQIREIIQNCFDNTLLSGIEAVFLNGGYFKIPEDKKIFFEGTEFADYYKNSQLIIPEAKDVEKELNKYIESNLDFCINKELFNESGFEINYNNISSEISIKNEKISSNLKTQFFISKDTSTYEISNINSENNIDIEKFLRISKEIIEKSGESGRVCLTCLAEISNINGISAEGVSLINEEDEKTYAIVYSIIEKRENYDIIWRFGIKNED